MANNNIIEDPKQINEIRNKIFDYLKTKYASNSQVKFNLDTEPNGIVIKHNTPIKPEDLPNGFQHTTNYMGSGYSGIYGLVDGKYVFIRTEPEKSSKQTKTPFELMFELIALNFDLANKISVKPDGTIQIVDLVGNFKPKLPTDIIYDASEGCFKSTILTDYKINIEVVSAHEESKNNISTNETSTDTIRNVNKQSLDDTPRNGVQQEDNNERIQSVTTADLLSSDNYYNKAGEVITSNTPDRSYGTVRVERDSSAKTEYITAIKKIWVDSYLKTYPAGKPEEAFSEPLLKIFAIIIGTINTTKNYNEILDKISSQLSNENRNIGMALVENFLTNEIIITNFGLQNVRAQEQETDFVMVKTMEHHN